MKASVWPVFGLLLGLSGCLPAVDGTNFFLSSKESKSVSARCRELNRIGDLEGTRAMIAADMGRIKNLIAKDNVEAHREDLSRYSQRVKASTKQLLQLAKPEYVSPDYPQRLRWSLSAEQLGLAEKSEFRWWKIKSVSLAGVYDWKGENKALKKRMSLRHDQSRIELRLERSASLVDICQLQQTLVVQLNVNFQSPLESQTRVYRLLAKNWEERP